MIAEYGGAIQNLIVCLFLNFPDVSSHKEHGPTSNNNNSTQKVECDCKSPDRFRYLLYACAYFIMNVKKSLKVFWFSFRNISLTSDHAADIPYLFFNSQ